MKKYLWGGGGGGGGEQANLFQGDKEMGTPRRASRLQVDFEPWDDNDTEPYQISTLHVILNFVLYEGGSICNENPFITPSTNALGLYAICKTKDQSTAVIMVQETLFYLSKFNKLQTF